LRFDDDLGDCGVFWGDQQSDPTSQHGAERRRGEDQSTASTKDGGQFDEVLFMHPGLFADTMRPSGVAHCRRSPLDGGGAAGRIGVSTCYSHDSAARSR